jgi:NAD(P)-dependent dehydrogenase (short-subunit alcohol dehydrogenase family)
MNIPAAEMTVEEWNKVSAINLTGVFLTAQAAGTSVLATMRVCSFAETVSPFPFNDASFLRYYRRRRRPPFALLPAAAFKLYREVRRLPGILEVERYHVLLPPRKNGPAQIFRGFRRRLSRPG